MRQLADLALLLGFREFAVATYKLAAQDYSAAGHAKWYGGAEVRGAGSAGVGAVTRGLASVRMGVAGRCCDSVIGGEA